ncbi:MAG: YceK/YidQ family lipoprotein [Planctomycetes bacterium]|nr:YceK/YidQ family lipoprotein [Planctomycetota bacterium]
MLPDAWRDVHVYAGTALDLGILGWVCGVWDFPPERRGAQHAAWAMLLFDLPFSLLGDTLLLPMTLCQQVGIIPRPAPQER